jgi:SAM-dependent methyltransferase
VHVRLLIVQYCEYMSERGELCLLVDVMEAMPFAQRSFDLIHVSWVYHGQTPKELWEFVHEIDRILRPGGYLYLRGGWSNSQIIAQRSMLAALGYTVLYEKVLEKPSDVQKKISFGDDLPYNADWVAILLKPISAKPADEITCKQRVQKEANSKVKLPLKARKAPTQMGNIYEEE